MAKYVDMEESGSPLARAFGQRLRARRTELNLTISDLFQRTAITVSYISAVERGRANPSLDVMVKLSEAVQSRIDEMLRPVE